MDRFRDAIKTGVLSVLYYFIGPPILLFIIPLILTKWARSQPVKLREKVIVITGASSGLGEALSHELYKQGCKVILAARRLEQLERVKSDLLALNCSGETYTPEIIQMDVSELKSLPGLADRILKIHGRIDVLINNAGISFRGRVDETSMEVHHRVMLVNYFGQIALTKAFLPTMLSQKSGQIVMINSVQGKIGIPFRSAYAASKHALQAYSDSLRAEIGEKGVTVTVINPGYINTPLSINALTGSGAQYAKMDDTTANGYDPVYVSKRIIKSLSNNDKEVIIAPFSPKLAIIIRTLIPSLYFILMHRRAQKNI